MATRVESGPPAPARPTGTVTFLFSDIEGSTSRWDAAPDAMASAIARHDALMRAALESHCAYVFKTIGDAFCAAFAMPHDAIAAALDIQHALALEDFTAVHGLRVRVALHTGTAVERDGDYLGPAVNRVARLLAIGHGGQVLVSSAAAQLLRDVMPIGSSLSDLGTHRLKDLSHPEHVYQLIAPNLPQTFPALRSLDHLQHNLPAQVNSLIGRDDVIVAIKRMLEQHRLVTIVGTGGVGKTRSAIQIGAELLDDSRDGVWLIELAPVSDSSLVAGAVARVLDVPEAPNLPALDTLVAHLKRKRVLLIFDNCEHVIDAVRNVAAAIVRSCPDVRILSTSREGLNVAGEQQYQLPPLSVPPIDASGTAHDVLEFGAPLLFAERAFAANSRFNLTDENASDVAEICRHLDGIPLAIELAAARVKVLTPQQIAQKLDDRFRVLTGGDRTALPRHQTMRALIDWSYDLLSSEERGLFRKLSIFAGGFTLSTVSVVCGSEDETSVLDRLSSLVDKSLIQTEATSAGARYRLLESMRQYARERLSEHGEFADVAFAHATTFLALAVDLEGAFERTADRVWLEQTEPEIDNWRAALDWALVRQNDSALGQRLALTLRWMWLLFAPSEGLRWIHSATQTTDERTPAVIIANLHLTEAQLDASLGQRRSGCEAAERALALFTHIKDERGIATATWLIGHARISVGLLAEGEALLRDALSIARRLNLGKLICRILIGIALARVNGNDFAGARAHYAEALAIARTARFDRLASAIAGDLAEAQFREGDVLAALQLAREALEAARANRDTRIVALNLANIATYSIALGEHAAARSNARDALVLSRDTHFEILTAGTLQHLAAVAALRSNDNEESARRDRMRAAGLLGYVSARFSQLEALREYTEQREYDETIAALRDAVDVDTLSNVMNEGSLWSEERAFDEALQI